MPPPLSELFAGRSASALWGQIRAQLRSWQQESLERRFEPIRWIVASGPQRRQAVRWLAADNSDLGVGVQVITLWALARMIVERHDPPSPGGDELFPVLAEREIRARARLIEHLGGPGRARHAVAALRDLLSAGLEPSHRDGALALLSNEQERELCEAALRCNRSQQELQVDRSADRLRRAARLLRGDPSLLSARAVLISGFEGANGAARELLVALLDTFRSALFIQLPRDPGDPQQEDSGSRWARRFAAELRPESAIQALDEPSADRPRIQLRNAAGIDAEVRAAIEQVRSAIDAGVAAESIGVVARSTEPYAIAWRRHAEAQGIPYSGALEPLGLCPEWSRASAWLTLFEQQERAPLDLWLPLQDDPHERQLRLAFRVLGLRTVAELAQIELERALEGKESLPLPEKVGMSDPDETRGTQVRRSFCSRRWLEQAQTRAQQSVRRWRERPERASIEQHRRLLERHGEWLDQLPPQFQIGRGELPALLRSCAEKRLRRRLNEQELDGGGVQFLDLARARGIWFELLIVLGVNRDQFPRQTIEDPLLSDTARGALRRLIPALGQRAEAALEDRFQFASLLANAKQVTLSWQRAGERGEALVPSPYIDRLRIASPAHAEPALQLEIVPRPLDLRLAQLESPTPRESLMLVALGGDRGNWSEIFAATHAAESSAALAAARSNVLNEQDPPFLLRSRRSPYLGAIGSLPLESPPVTLLERTAECGWRAFLTRYLRIEQIPDPAYELPSPDGRLIGSATHLALELALRAVATSLPAAIDRPDHRVVAAAIGRASLETCRAAGLWLPGFAALLGRRIAPAVTIALDLSFARQPRIELVALEDERQTVPLEGAGNLTVRFRADRVERGDGGNLLIDYKLGKSPADNAKDSTRRAKLLNEIEAGTLLQAAAYARSEGAARGRYLYIRPERLEYDAARVLDVASDDADAAEKFERAVAMTGGVWRAGQLLPRLIDRQGKTPNLCERCEVRRACLVGDSAARRRLIASIPEHAADTQEWWQAGSSDEA